MGLIRFLCVVGPPDRDTEKSDYSDNTFYDLVDDSGKRALVRSVEVLEARSGEINLLYIRSLTGAGMIENIASNLGKVEIVNEGGVISVNTHLNSPLPVGEKVEHILTYEGVNCFMEPTETVTQNVTRTLGSSGVHVTVPATRPLRRVEGKLALEGRPEKGGNLEVRQDKLGASFFVKSPVVGSRLILTWEW